MNAPQGAPAAAGRIAQALAPIIANIEKITAVTGSVPDIIAAVDVIRGWAQAQDGLTYEAHTFAVSGPDDKEPADPAKPPAPPGTRTTKSGRTSDAIRPTTIKPTSKRSEVEPIPIVQPQPQQRPASTNRGLPINTTKYDDVILENPEVVGELDYLVTLTTSVSPVNLLEFLFPGLGAVQPVASLIGGPVLEQLASYLGTDNVATFGLSFRRTGPKSFLCATSLRKHIGFDTALGSQAACSFGGESQEIPGAGTWHMLSFNGWINKAGPGVTSPGFIRFGGYILVGVDGAGGLALIPSRCYVVSPSGVGNKTLGWSSSQGYVIEI